MLNDFYLHLGEMIYENVASGERWFTALDPESRLYFYSIDPDTLETRSEWSLPVHPVSAESRDKVGIMTLTALSILQLRSKYKYQIQVHEFNHNHDKGKMTTCQLPNVWVKFRRERVT